MGNQQETVKQISEGMLDKTFGILYSETKSSASRYSDLLNKHKELFGERKVSLFSAPGRTEIGGNHTDHQRGRVLAASVNLDVIAVASKNDDNIVRIKSAGYDMDEIDLNQLIPLDREKEHSASLIRGVCAKIKDLGFEIGGFDAYTTSNVLKGSGLSSSAAFEVLTGTIVSHLFNDGKISPVAVAQIGQYAENVFFGKPSGLMDQMASSVGGFVFIDFKDTGKPVIEKVDFDFAGANHSLCITDTGGNHADLTSEYAAITYEMRSVAEQLDGTVLRDIEDVDLISKVAGLRESCTDRAIIRAFHSLEDSKRVLHQVKALRDNDFEQFKRLIIESGHSSFEYLQNIYSSANVNDQCVSLALAVSQSVLNGRGAWRVHGGGFGGTIQAFVPNDLLDTYKTTMENALGEGCCHILNIRPVGGTKVF